MEHRLGSELIDQFLFNSPWVKLDGVDWSCVTDDAQLKQFNKNEVIFHQLEKSPYVYVVKQGRVRMELLNAHGESKTVFIADQDSFFGELNYIDGGSNMCNAIAVTEAHIYLIPYDRFQQELRTNSTFCMSMLQLLSQKTRLLMTQVMQLSFDNSYQKVAYALFNQARQYGMDTPEGRKLLVRFTHQDLGNLLGLSRVSVSNILSDMYTQKLVVKKNGSTYVDMDGLLAALRPQEETESAPTQES